MIDPCDDVGEGGTKITNECQGARSGLVRAYRVILILILTKTHSDRSRVSHACHVRVPRPRSPLTHTHRPVDPLHTHTRGRWYRLQTTARHISGRAVVTAFLLDWWGPLVAGYRIQKVHRVYNWCNLILINVQGERPF